MNNRNAKVQKGRTCITRAPGMSPPSPVPAGKPAILLKFGSVHLSGSHVSSESPSWQSYLN